MGMVTNTLASTDAMPQVNFQDSKDLKTLFINGSAFPGGNTLAIASSKLTKFDTVNLADVDMPLYVGQGTPEQVSNFFETMKNYDRIVIGSPVYFSGLTGLTETLIDWETSQSRGFLQGKHVIVFVRGMAPEPVVEQAAYVTLKHFAWDSGATFEVLH
jgi:hypothetical protein